MYYYVVPYLISIGYSTDRAALLFGALGIASLVGFILFGTLADRMGTKITLVVGLSICALSALLPLAAGDPAIGPEVVVAFVILWGATFNLCNQFAPLLQVEVVGPSNFGLLLGISTLLAGSASSLGPLVTGFVFDATNSYSAAFKICAFLMGMALIPTLAIDSYRRFLKAKKVVGL
jgi:predicted MFS family arabinose efflux permease